MKRRRSTATLATFLSLALLSPHASLAQEAGNSILAGKLVEADGKTPLAGARMHVYHLSSEETYVSDPTGPDGKYQMEGLPFGYFDMAIETGEGMFVADQVVNLPPSGKVVVTLAVARFGTEETRPEDEARIFPGSDDPASGVARVSKKATGRQFWRSSKGVAILAGGAAVLLLLIAVSGGSSEDTPPVSSASLPSQ